MTAFKPTGEEIFSNTTSMPIFTFSKVGRIPLGGNRNTYRHRRRKKKWLISHITPRGNLWSTYLEKSKGSLELMMFEPNFLTAE